MSWTTLSDTALDAPRMLALPRGVRLLHLEALAYSGRYGLDGRIPGGALARLTDEPDPEAAVELLIEAGAWRGTDDGWELVWLQEDQLTAEEAAANRARAQARKARSRRHLRGDHSTCDPRHCDARREEIERVTRDGTRDDRVAPVTLPTPPHPTPPHSGVRVGVVGDAAGLADAAGVALTDEEQSGEEHVACDDFAAHQTSHRRRDGAWVCDICALEREVRDAKSPDDRRRFQRTLDRERQRAVGAPIGAQP